MKKIVLLVLMLLLRFDLNAAADQINEIITANIDHIKIALQDPKCSLKAFFEDDADLVGNIVTGFDYHAWAPIDAKHFSKADDAQQARKYLVVLCGSFPVRIWVLADRMPEFITSSVSSLHEYLDNRLFRDYLQQFAPREDFSRGGEIIRQFIVDPGIEKHLQPRIFADFVYVFPDRTLKIDARAQEHEDVNAFRFDACWPGDPLFGNWFDTSMIFKCRQCLIL